MGLQRHTIAYLHPKPQRGRINFIQHHGQIACGRRIRTKINIAVKAQAAADHRPTEGPCRRADVSQPIGIDIGVNAHRVKQIMAFLVKHFNPALIQRQSQLDPAIRPIEIRQLPL